MTGLFEFSHPGFEHNYAVKRVGLFLHLCAVLLAFALFPSASHAQSLPSGTASFPINTGTEVSLGGWYTAPVPPACTPQPAGSTTATIAPQYGSLRYQNISSTLPAGYPCAGTTIISTIAYYTWNRIGSGDGTDYFHLHYTDVYGGTNNADWNAVLNTGIPSKSLGKPNSCTNCAGDPVSISSGNMFYEAKDYTTAGANPLAFIRYYNSRSAVGAPTLATTLGVGWRSNFDRWIRIASTTNVAVERPNGQQLYFTLISGVWTPDTDVDIKLTLSGTTWTLTDHDDSIETYTTSGSGTFASLNSIKLRNGYTQTLAYTSGTLTSVTDSYSRVLTFTYASGLISTVFTEDSTTITYGYSSSTGGPLLHTVAFPTPTGTITYNYGASSSPVTALTSIVDENGFTYASWIYDAYSRATQSQLGSGANLTTIAYSDDGSFNRDVTNAFGVIDHYNYLFRQGIPKSAGINRNSTPTTPTMSNFYSYDPNGYIYAWDSWNNVPTQLTNNSHGDPTQIVEASGTSNARTTTITYDTTWVHLPKTIVEPGLTTTFTYDISGNLLTKTLTDTTTTTIPYSTNGQTRTWTYTWLNHLLASVQSPRTDVTAITSYSYDGLATLRSITDALGHVTNVPLAQTGGYPQHIVDPNGVTSGFSWDARQRLAYQVVYTSAANYTDYFNRDAVGQITQFYPADGAALNYTYDTAHRLTKITDAYSEPMQYTLDALGNTTQTKISDGGGTQLRNHTATFDALGRKLTDVGGASQTTTFTYDRDGNALTIKDGLNQTTTRVFDSLDRLSTSTDANSGVLTYTYDAHDRPLTIQDQNGHTTSYVYDGFGDVIQETSPDRGTTVYHYDNNGNLTSKTDALGVVTNQTFDKLDRVLTTTYPADSTLNVAYTYDQTGTGFSFGIGRLTSITDQAGSLSRAYDERGNLLTEKRVNGGNTYTTSYTYNSSSRLLTTTYPDGTVATNQYDLPGRVYIMSAKPAGASSATTIASLINHLPYGPLKYIGYGNSYSETWFFDLDYRATGLTANAGSITAPALISFGYSYDAANNVRTITDYVTSGNTETLTYDVLNRLKTAVGGYGSYTYTWDNVGNLTAQQLGSTTTNYTYTTGSNRLSAADSTAVSTNANGNITAIPVVSGGTAATFSYSKANRLSAVSGGASTAITGIVYDAWGKRFSKAHASGSPILYFYDQDGNLIAENNGGTYTDYVYVDGIPLAVIQPTATVTANQINYVSTNKLGTAMLAVNNIGTTVWSNTYRPLGQGGIPSSTITNNLRLPGQEYDSETGFHYNLNRDYIPNLGRYLQSDPTGLQGGINPYLYARANPYIYKDRSGLISWNDVRVPVIRAVAAVAVAVNAYVNGVGPTDFQEGATTVEESASESAIEAASTRVAVQTTAEATATSAAAASVASRGPSLFCRMLGPIGVFISYALAPNQAY